MKFGTQVVNPIENACGIDQLMAFSLPNQLVHVRQLRHGISLSLSLVFLGWVMAAYQMPAWGWGITILCLIHVSKRGRSAIPIAFAWINGVIWVAAYQFAMPAGFIWRNAKYWSASLMILWGMATIIVFAIAKIPQLYPRHAQTQLTQLLPVTLICLGLCLGLVLYQSGLSPQ